MVSFQFRAVQKESLPIRHSYNAIGTLISDLKRTISVYVIQIESVSRKFGLSHWSLSQVSLSELCNMDRGDIQEIRRVVHRREELIQANRSAILFVSYKASEIEQAFINQNTNAVSILEHQKQRIDFLEVECNRLRNLTLIQHMESLTMASNNRETENSVQVEPKEEETVHQPKHPMEIEGQSSPQSDEEQEDECSAFVYR
jgi:hypothetical protein